jgi:hypothetical protein
VTPHTWEHRSGGYSPYATWARDAVDALWWLTDLDDWAYSGERANLGGHDPDLVDIAHVRWATGTAKTAIDFCAADAAVGHEVRKFWRDRPQDLGDGPEDFAFQILPKELQEHADRLSCGVARWLSALLDDADYKALKAVRDVLTHRMTVRSALLRTRPAQWHQDRTLFAVQVPAVEGRPDARGLILFARDVATRQVEGYLEAAS